MNDSNRHTRRRWFQLSLRSIFLLTLIVAAYFAGYRTAVHHVEQAQEAERAARKLAEDARQEAQRQEELAIRELQRAEFRALAAQFLRERAAAERGGATPAERAQPKEE